MKSSYQPTARKRKNRFEYQVLEPRQMLSANLPSLDLQIELTRDFLSNNVETQYLLDGSNDVQFVELRHGLAATTALFQQTNHGLPVYGGYLTVEQDTLGGFMSVNDNGVKDLATTSSTTPIIGVEVAQ